MNDCHPTDEVRAFMTRAQPTATQTAASDVQPRLRGVLAAGGGLSKLANCPCVAHGTRWGAGIRGMWIAMSRLVPRSSLLRNGADLDGCYRTIRSVSCCPVHPGPLIRVLHGPRPHVPAVGAPPAQRG